MAGEIFLIRTPLGRLGDLTYGGSMRIKVGRKMTYAGFSSVALAEEVCEYWQIPARRSIELWHDAVRHDAPDGRPLHILLFRDRADFDSYLMNPTDFGYNEHLVSLHPEAVGAA